MSGQPVAIVTGGTSGIGLAIATALQAGGYAVTVTGLHEAEVAAAPRTLNARRLDVADAAAVEALAGEHERIDALVNAAGMIMRELREFEPLNFSRVLDVNVTGTMRMCVAARKRMTAGAAIVNIASIMSFFANGASPAYTASKGAVAQLTKALALAWAPDGIRVNAIAPCWIATNFTRAVQDDPKRNGAIVARTPMARWGEPEDIAGPALFLCSPAARFITGAVLPVDGGYAAA